VADGRATVRRLPLQPAGDLLRRPAGCEPLDHVRPQTVVGGQLAAPLATPAGQVLGGQREVAAEAAVANSPSGAMHMGYLLKCFHKRVQLFYS
jgi:hypothetical protein